MQGVDPLIVEADRAHRSRIGPVAAVAAPDADCTQDSLDIAGSSPDSHHAPADSLGTAAVEGSSARVALAADKRPSEPSLAAFGVEAVLAKAAFDTAAAVRVLAVFRAPVGPIACYLAAADLARDCCNCHLQ